MKKIIVLAIVMCLMLCGCSKDEPKTTPTTIPTSEPVKETTQEPTKDDATSKAIEELNQEIQDEIQKTHSKTEILNYDTLYAAANIAITDMDIYMELRSATESGYIIIDSDGVSYDNLSENFIKIFEQTVGKDALAKMKASSKLIIEILPGASVKRLQPPAEQ